MILSNPFYASIEMISSFLVTMVNYVDFFFFFNSWDKLYSYSVMTFYPFVYVGFDLLKSQEFLTLWS